MGIKRVLVISALCMCFAVTAEAQKAATVKSLTQTTDHVPVNDRRSDLNGSPCALVKVQVVDQIERVEGNKIGEIVNRGVEKWVYMCKGSRNMRIHLKNHLPVKVMFQDYQINGLESNRVYELVLNIPDAPVTPTVQETARGTFGLRISPQTATVSIWGDKMQYQDYRPQNDGSLTVTLPYGRYFYKAQAEGYHASEGNFFVSDNNQTEIVNLAPTIVENLSISCPTVNVDFIIDGSKVDKKKSATHWAGRVSVGRHDVIAKRNGYVTQSQTINVPANQAVSVTFDKLKTEAEQKAEKERTERESKTQIAQQKAKSDEIYYQRGEQRKANVQKAARGTQAGEKNVSFGLQAGVNLASLGVSEGSCSMKTGFHVGPSADFRLSNSWYLKTALMFSQKGYKYDGDGILFAGDWYYLLEEATALFVSLPILFSYRIGSFQINFGPYLDYGVGGEIDCFDVQDTFNHYDALNYGLTGGVGVTLAKHYYIGINYESGLSDYANRNIAISLGYKF